MPWICSSSVMQGKLWHLTVNCWVHISVNQTSKVLELSPAAQFNVKFGISSKFTHINFNSAWSNTVFHPLWPNVLIAHHTCTFSTHAHTHLQIAAILLVCKLFLGYGVNLSPWSMLRFEPSLMAAEGAWGGTRGEWAPFFKMSASDEVIAWFSAKID